MVFKSLGIALAATAGRYVGRGEPTRVPLLCSLASTLALLAAGAIGSTLYLLRAPLARMLTSDATIDTVIRATMLGPVLSLPGYGLLTTLAGACRGINQQRAAALATAVGYLVGLPLAYYLGVGLQWPRGRPLLGVWTGNAVAVALGATIVVVVLCRIDWPRVARARPVSARSWSPPYEADGSAIDGRVGALDARDAPLLGHVQQHEQHQPRPQSRGDGR